MKRLLITVMLLGLLGTLGLNAGAIKAMKVPGNVSKIGPDSKAWISADFTDVLLFPKKTIQTITQDANESQDSFSAKRVRIKALHDGKNIAFMMIWQDKTQNFQHSTYGNYGDGFAVQIATHIDDVKKLPYIVKGSKDRVVVLHEKIALDIDAEDINFMDVSSTLSGDMQHDYTAKLAEYKKMAQGVYSRVFMGEGIQALREIKDDASVMEMVYQNAIWKGTLSRGLKDSNVNFDEGIMAVSFVVWDGDTKNYKGVEHLSGWLPVKLSNTHEDETLTAELTAPINGNILNGRKLMMENCAVCHHYANERKAPESMAPELFNIGGYSAAAYLMESLLHPSAVIVPDPHLSTDKFYAWQNEDDSGNIKSTMPSFEWMDEQSLQDIVAYLKTLKAEAEH